MGGQVTEPPPRAAVESSGIPTETRADWQLAPPLRLSFVVRAWRSSRVLAYIHVVPREPANRTGHRPRAPHGGHFGIGLAGLGEHLADVRGHERPRTHCVPLEHISRYHRPTRHGHGHSRGPGGGAHAPARRRSSAAPGAAR